MGKSQVRRRMAVGGLLAMGLVALVGVLRPASVPPLRWRLALIQSKLAGGMPGVSWAAAARAMLPNHLPETWTRRTGWVVSRADEGGGPCPVLWETPLGSLWGRAFDDAALENFVQEQTVLKVYEHEVARVKPGDVVLDLGSHLGTFTHYALGKGARLVVAFEPEPANATCFLRTFGREIQQGRVVLMEAAAWNTPGELKFQTSIGPSVDRRAQGASGAVAERGQLTVRAVTIDGTVSALALDSVDFIKMDIEGAERYALEGAMETLSRFHPRMALCVYHRRDDRQVVPAIALKAHPAYRVHLTEMVAYLY